MNNQNQKKRTQWKPTFPNQKKKKKNANTQADAIQASTPR